MAVLSLLLLLAIIALWFAIPVAMLYAVHPLALPGLILVVLTLGGIDWLQRRGRGAARRR